MFYLLLLGRLYSGLDLLIVELVKGKGFNQLNISVIENEWTTFLSETKIFTPWLYS